MIDLHCHSTHSDGELGVKELLILANKNNLNVFSITDHDNVDAHIELLDLPVKEYYQGELLVGCEFNSIFEGIRIELLGYNFDLLQIKEWLDTNNSIENRHKTFISQYEKLIEKCKEVNLKIDKEKYDPDIFYPIDFMHKLISKYPENKSIIGDEAFSRKHIFYRKTTNDTNFILYFDQSDTVTSLKEISELIRKNGGLVFLAHPFSYEINDFTSFHKNIISSGLIDSLERFHSNYNLEVNNKLINLCKENNLYISAGSDFHR